MPATGTRKEIRGAASRLTLAAGITGASGQATVNGNVTGWPTGVGGIPFVVHVDPGKANAEKILCSTLAGSSPATVTFLTRGWDNTPASQHDADAVVGHVLDADTLMMYMLHIWDATRDDHSQYLHVDGSRGFTALTSALVDDPVSIGTANDEGDDLKLARADHVHKIGNGSINAKALFDTATIRPVYYGATAPVSPTVGDLWFNTTTGQLKTYYGPTTLWQYDWHTAWGQLAGGYASASADQTGINAMTDLTNLTCTVTVPAGRIVKVTWTEPDVVMNLKESPGELNIREGSTILKKAIWSVTTNNGNPRVLHLSRRLTPTVGAHTYKASAYGAATTFDFFRTSVVDIAELLVEDVGPAADPVLT